ncbi:MAG: hypothetical protein KGL39_49420, partial [Patescibacteria group bacterium]|nr:hypothetical protein [Patescibacteria group bacterium]
MRRPLQVITSSICLLAVGWLGLPAPTKAQNPVHPSPQAPVRIARKFPTGAKSSRAKWLAHEQTKDPRFKHFVQAAPAQFTPAVILTMAQMSYWGNDQFGDCVTAEEAASLDVWSVWYSAAGMSQRVDLPDATVEQWASQNGYLNGAMLTDVMDSMAKSGITYNNVTYTDGPYTSVDYTNWATLCSAIYQGPVKVGIASSQLSNTQAGNQNGWIGTGWRNDQNEDHCVGLWGYGTMTELCSVMNVMPPANAAQYTQCVLVYTWDTIGIVDFASLGNVVGEAWLRSPTHPQIVPPNPNPTPTPSSFTWSLGPNPPVGATLDQSGNFTWAIPA